MITFSIGIVILLVGGFFYGLLMEKIFKPDNRKTPAERINDGVDFVTMPKWKNCFIQLLNIAGTGPILGPIQGILFGPIAFLTIPIGCIIGGAVHDYYCGMISMRNDGMQMSGMVQKYLGKGVNYAYSVVVIVALLLLGTVFLYTPGDLFVTDILKQEAVCSNYVMWICYGVILTYYIVATIFPIDKIIGKIYPIFGSILLISAVAIFVGIYAKGYRLTEIWETGFMPVAYQEGLHFIPIFFVTVACGITSGFHSTQSTIISRTVGNEKEGRSTFYSMMILEGFIAMIWAGATMGILNIGDADENTPPMNVVNIVSMDFLGNVGGIIAILGVIILALTSGDTALRSLRLIIAEIFHIPQEKAKYRVGLASLIFIPLTALLFFVKLDQQNGFSLLWRYFAWTNQFMAVFTFAVITVYLCREKKAYIVSLVPGMFYAFIICSYIMNEKIGFHLPYVPSIIIGIVFSIAYGVFLVLLGKKGRKTL